MRITGLLDRDLPCVTKWKLTLPHLPKLDWATARGTLMLSGAALLTGMTVLFGWVDWLAFGKWARPHAVPLALFAAAGGGLIAAGWRLRGQRAPRTRASGMSWWIVPAAAIVVVVVAWGTTNWLLGEAAAAKDPGAARVDAIKTGLGIGAGTTGIFALLLAVRRQWHSESDATEKNVTELYTKAADQLGSNEAPVRLAGLYALERLAQANPEQRQSIVNVICAYLRMPYTPLSPAATVSAEHEERIQRREVRLAGQRILINHLDPRDRRTFWTDIDIDLTNAHLIGFTFGGCQPRNARFSGATFAGDATFDGATFTGDATFDGADFSRDASFDGATFTGDATFHRSTFTRDVSFHQATFASTASFAHATFIDVAWFDDTRFTRDAWFIGATFIEGARFRSANFTHGARFRSATFTGDVSFDGATFTGGARFISATFTGNVSFDSATFTSYSSFDSTTFAGDVSFDGATLTGDASFDSTTFAGSLPTIDWRLAQKAAFANVILTNYSPNRTTVAGIVADARGAQATAEAVEVSPEPQSPRSRKSPVRETRTGL